VTYLDTNILIYLLEGHPQYGEQIVAALEELTGQGDLLVASVITVTEFLAGTTSSNLDTLQQIPKLRFAILDDTLAGQAAGLQRKHSNLQIGAAIHLATAIREHATLFFTNDKQLAKVVAEYLQVRTLV
jgi:predicted nucleic acid-binding protein